MVKQSKRASRDQKAQASTRQQWWGSAQHLSVHSVVQGTLHKCWDQGNSQPGPCSLYSGWKGVQLPFSQIKQSHTRKTPLTPKCLLKLWRAEEMAQGVMCLLCDHEDMSSDLQSACSCVCVCVLQYTRGGQRTTLVVSPCLYLVRDRVSFYWTLQMPCWLAQKTQGFSWFCLLSCCRNSGIIDASCCSLALPGLCSGGCQLLCSW